MQRAGGTSDNGASAAKGGTSDSGASAADELQGAGTPPLSVPSIGCSVRRARSAGPVCGPLGLEFLGLVPFPAQTDIRNIIRLRGGHA